MSTTCTVLSASDYPATDGRHPSRTGRPDWRQWEQFEILSTAPVAGPTSKTWQRNATVLRLIFSQPQSNVLGAVRAIPAPVSERETESFLLKVHYFSTKRSCSQPQQPLFRLVQGIRALFHLDNYQSNYVNLRFGQNCASDENIFPTNKKTMPKSNLR